MENLTSSNVVSVGLLSSSAAAAAASVNMEREGNALGGLFQNIITDLRTGTNNWDDLLLKANKFHMQLKSTINSSTAFLDAFQKIADMATTTRGGTKEIGSALTRLCLRNRSVEAKLKSLTSSLFDSFISPLQDRVDEWKKIIVQIDKEHNKEIKRLKQFRKKHSSEITRSSVVASSVGFSNNTFKMKKNPRNKMSKSDFPRIGSMYEVDKILESMDNNKEKYFMLEEVERKYVRRALIEERSHYCLFFNLLRPVIEEEISMLQEIIHLEEVLTTLSNLTNDPHKLPSSSENFLTNLQLNDQVTHDLTYAEYASSIINGGASTVSRKSSISSMDSFNTLSTDSISYRNCKSLSQPNITPGFRPKSIASQDSGFLSHDYNIPNIGRLAPNKNNPSVCMLNGKPVICSNVSTNVDKEINSKVEYATSESLFHNNNSNTNNPTISNGTLCRQQPIYVNVTDPSCFTNSAPIRSNNCARYSSEGSITPTNPETIVDESDNCTKCYVEIKPPPPPIEKKPIYLKPKPIPPKPPVRQSSKLSTNKSSNVNDSTTATTTISEAANKRSTLIYVQQQNKDNSMDGFPPPPPEAYMTVKQTNEVSTINATINENICCRYSTPNSHFVFCDNQECLKDLNGNVGSISTANSTTTNEHQHHYASTATSTTSAHLPNSFSFESNLDQKCQIVDMTRVSWLNQHQQQQQTISSANYIYDHHHHHHSQHQPQLNGGDGRYHSSVNLSSDNN